MTTFRGHRAQNLRTAIILLSTFAALFAGSVLYIIVLSHR